MFDRFYRADSSRATSGGFGIGLAMAQAIVTSHNGRIYAELSDDHILSISASFPTQYGSFKLITNFVEKQPKNVNNNSQNNNVSAKIDTYTENADVKKDTSDTENAQEYNEADDTKIEDADEIPKDATANSDIVATEENGGED